MVALFEEALNRCYHHFDARRRQISFFGQMGNPSKYVLSLFSSEFSII